LINQEKALWSVPDQNVYALRLICSIPSARISHQPKLQAIWAAFILQRLVSEATGSGHVYGVRAVYAHTPVCTASRFFDNIHNLKYRAMPGPRLNL
jgi:hypothetical protein